MRGFPTWAAPAAVLAVLLLAAPAAGLLGAFTTWTFEGTASTYNSIETGPGCPPFVGLFWTGRLRVVLQDGPTGDVLSFQFDNLDTLTPLPCAVARACAGEGDATRGWTGLCGDAIPINGWSLTLTSPGHFRFAYAATTPQPGWRIWSDDLAGAPAGLLG